MDEQKEGKQRLTYRLELLPEILQREPRHCLETRAVALHTAPLHHSGYLKDTRWPRRLLSQRTRFDKERLGIWVVGPVARRLEELHTFVFGRLGDYFCFQHGGHIPDRLGASLLGLSTNALVHIKLYQTQARCDPPRDTESADDHSASGRLVGQDVL